MVRTTGVPGEEAFLSIIVPVFNEEENVPLLHANLSRILEKQPFTYEVIYVDDGSSDNSFQQLSRLATFWEAGRIYQSQTRVRGEWEAALRVASRKQWANSNQGPEVFGKDKGRAGRARERQASDGDWKLSSIKPDRDN